jgi:hypothetical protein
MAELGLLAVDLDCDLGTGRRGEIALLVLLP